MAFSVLGLEQIGSPIAEGADTTTSSTIAGPLLAITFPVQGKCSFIDTFGAPRSGGRFHEGVDLIAKSGQFVYAAADGTLTKQYIDAPGSLSGNGWRLTAAGGTYYFYAHFSGFAAGLKVGSKVVAGQIIGYVGSTGNAGTPHLHFEIHPGGGAAVNPTPSVKAVDGCAVTTIPPVATNPSIPGAIDSGPPQPTLAKAVRIPASVSPDAVTTTTTSAATTTTTTATTTTTVATAPAVVGSRWTFVEPVVIFNGSGGTALVANTPKQISIAGFGGIVSTTTGLVLRVSATATAAGAVTVHPCASMGEATTTLAVASTAMAIGTTMVPVASGKICVTSSVAASVKLTAIAQSTATGTGIRPILTRRSLDTRTSGRLAAGQKVSISPAALGTAPAAKGVTATFTIVNPSAAGTLSVSACGGTEMKAPFANTLLAAFSATVAINAAGLCVSSNVATDVIIDITAGWDNDAEGLTAVAPVRVLGTTTSPVAISSATTNVNVAGVGGLPGSVSVAVVQMTVVADSTSASVFVWPCDQPRPVAAAGVAAAGRTATFSATTAVAAGQICIATNAPATSFVDVTGAS